MNKLDNILVSMNDFEKRNNVSISIEMFSDGSWNVTEFWDEEPIKRGDDLESLITYLNTAKYKIAKNGRCIRPMQRIDLENKE